MKIESTHNIARKEALHARALNMTTDELIKLRSTLKRELLLCSYGFSNKADYLARDIETCTEILENRLTN